MNKIDPATVLANAKTIGDNYLKAFRLDGKHDKTLILSELSKRTHNGKPVVALLVDTPEEAVLATIFGVQVVSMFKDMKIDTQTQLREQLGDQLRGQLREQLGGQLWDQLWDQLREQLGDQLRGQLGDQLWDQLRRQIGGQLRGQLGDQLWDQLWEQLWEQLRGQLGDQLSGQLRGQLWDQLWEQLRRQIGGQLWEQLKSQESIKNLRPWDCLWDYYLMAFYDAASPQCPDQQIEFGKQSFFTAFQHGLGYVINLGSLIVGVCLPEAHRDTNIRIHNETGPAIVWGKNKQYWIHGVKVKEHIITNPASITIDEIDSETNVEIRRVMVSKYGIDRYIKDSNATKLHSDRFGILWQKPQKTGELLKVVQVKNSTPEGHWEGTPGWFYKNKRLKNPPKWLSAFNGVLPDGYTYQRGDKYVHDRDTLTNKFIYKDYFIRVPPTTKTAKEAVAWTFSMTEAEYLPLQET